MTQEEVAAQIGCTVKTYRSWEKGNELPSTNYLIELADLYNVDCDYLLGRIEQKNHDLEFVCSYTGLSADAVKNLAAINARENGNDDLSMASELIASQHFYSLTRSILDLKWCLEEVEAELRDYASFRESSKEIYSINSLQSKLRFLKALRYEVSETVLHVVDDNAEIDNTIREAEGYIDYELVNEKEADNG